MMVTIYERGCKDIVYPLPKGDEINNRRVISNVDIETFDYVPKTRDVIFKVIVEIDSKNIQSSPIFHKKGEDIATIDFCIRVDLVIPELDGQKNVSINFQEVEYRAKLRKVPQIDYRMKMKNGWDSNEYELLSSLTGRNAIASEL